jgi:hypothetical protein
VSASVSHGGRDGLHANLRSGLGASFVCSVHTKQTIPQRPEIWRTRNAPLARGEGGGGGGQRRRHTKWGQGKEQRLEEGEAGVGRGGGGGLKWSGALENVEDAGWRLAQRPLPSLQHRQTLGGAGLHGVAVGVGPGGVLDPCHRPRGTQGSPALGGYAQAPQGPHGGVDDLRFNQHQQQQTNSRQQKNGRTSHNNNSKHTQEPHERVGAARGVVWAIRYGWGPYGVVWATRARAWQLTGGCKWSRVVLRRSAGWCGAERRGGKG